MTVMAVFVGHTAIMWFMGTGSDVMKRIAAPMIGSIRTSFPLELLVYLPLYSAWTWRYELESGKALAVAGPDSGQP